MGRTFWFVAGASAGLYTTIKARRLASRLTPEGITDQVAAFGLGARAFAEEVRSGMAEREAQIAHRLALPAGTPVRRGSELRSRRSRIQPHRGARRWPPPAPDRSVSP